VLSDSTEGFDRGDKFADYRELDSLEDYVLVSQKRQQLDRFLRTATNEWLMTSYTIGSVVTLASVGLDLTMAEIYDEVPIEPIDPPTLT
jgi:Uma2 family endonuclease